LGLLDTPVLFVRIRVRMLMSIFSKDKIKRIAINMRPISHQWGGGNQWASQITSFLKKNEFEICYKLKPPLDCIIMADPRPEGRVTFGIKDIEKYKSKYPGTPCLHRVNECDLRKGTGHVDSILEKANSIADFTVFISKWLLEYHAGKWFDTRRPHMVIYNGADPDTFNPAGSLEFQAGESFRIVTHHWSDNWMKGFKAYQQLDDLIADGALPSTELWVIGRWPKELKWKKAITHKPTYGRPLAGLLKRCHAYITASLWEPCGMHHVEGAQCGLPVMYHEDGGGIVEAARNYGVSFRDDPKTAVETLRKNYKTYREKVLVNMPSGKLMCNEYMKALEDLI
jgi:glycosyltransferase involved in cell wall biosynthesis